MSYCVPLWPCWSNRPHTGQWDRGYHHTPPALLQMEWTPSQTCLGCWWQGDLEYPLGKTVWTPLVHAHCTNQSVKRNRHMRRKLCFKLQLSQLSRLAWGWTRSMGHTLPRNLASMLTGRTSLYTLSKVSTSTTFCSIFQ